MTNLIYLYAVKKGKAVKQTFKLHYYSCVKVIQQMVQIDCVKFWCMKRGPWIQSGWLIKSSKKIKKKILNQSSGFNTFCSTITQTSPWVNVVVAC